MKNFAEVHVIQTIEQLLKKFLDFAGRKLYTPVAQNPRKIVFTKLQHKKNVPLVPVIRGSCKRIDDGEVMQANNLITSNMYTS